jgi:phage terminase large subunit-like protein
MLINYDEINDYIADFSNNYKLRRLNFEFTPKQATFFNASKTAFEILVSGGNRSGKTEGALYQTFMHATGLYRDCYDGHKFDFAPKIWSCNINVNKVKSINQDKLIGNLSSNIEGFIHPSLILDKKSGKDGIYSEVYVKHASGEVSTINFKTYGEKSDKFQSDRVHFIHLDEQPGYEIYVECLMRLADTDGKGMGRILITQYPKAGLDELMAHFMLKKTVEEVNGLRKEETYKISPEDIVNNKMYLHVSWADNPHLTEEAKLHMRSAMKPHELEAREHGIPTIGDGMVYQIPESVFVVSPFEIPDHWARFAGMDLGWEDHTAVVFFAWDKDNDCMYIYKEYKYNHMTPETHAGVLLPQGLDWIPTICDPAGNMRQQSDGETLLAKYKSAGLSLIKGKRTRESSIMEIMQRINTDRFKIFSNCRNILNEWRSYSRKDGKVLDGNDHLMNAIEYPILLAKNYAITKSEYDSYNKYNYNAKPQLI